MSSPPPILLFPGSMPITLPPAPKPPPPRVIWIGSPYWTPGHERRNALVVHTMGGSLTSTDGWFRKNPLQVSSHYGVGLEGQMHQYVGLEHTAHANGILEPGNKWAARFGSDWPNDETIQIETEDRGSGSQVVTEAEYQGTLAVSRLALDYSPEIQVVSSHHVISPQSRANCCGARWIASGQLARLARELGLQLFI